MSNLYLVWTWDGYNDSCPHLQIIFTVEKEAVDYACNSYLPHRGQVWVAKEEIGICCPSRAFKPNYIYKRDHYDPQEALLQEISWSLFEGGIDKEAMIKHCINNYSPMCIDIDWAKLYKRYKERYE